MISEEQRTKHREYMRKYRKTAIYKAQHSKDIKRWNKLNAEKRKAHLAIGNAVHTGKLIKPTDCSKCGVGGTIHAHHDDYSKPFDVVWLCDDCHKALHKEEIN